MSAQIPEVQEALDFMAQHGTELTHRQAYELLDALQAYADELGEVIENLPAYEHEIPNWG